jgi:hypothetical protein
MLTSEKLISTPDREKTLYFWFHYTGQGKEKGFLQTAVHTTEDTLSVFIVRV